MSVKKRTGSTFYWCYFSIGGQRIRESTGTADREAAEQYEARRRRELWEQQRLGVKPRRSWQEAVVRYLGETAHKKSRKADVAWFRWLDPHLRDLAMQDIDEEVLRGLVDRRREMSSSNATINRMLSAVSVVVGCAFQDWRWIDRKPAFPRMKEPKKRVRWLRPEEAVALMAELPEHRRLMAEFALETGLRASNVAELRWSQIDMARRCLWVEPEDAKSGKAMGLPVTDRALEIVRSQMGRHLEFVFTYQRGKRPPQPFTGNASTKAWYKALKRAGITNFRWHDLRHTWASWHTQDGTPALALLELGGWSDVRMLQKYAHLNTEHLRAYVAGVGTKLTQPVPEKKKAST